jgi:ketosteroid isomerase-like protein
MAMSSSVNLGEAGRQIDLRSREFERNFAARDVEALVNGYFAADEETPTACPPGRQRPVSGRAALKELFAAQFEAIRAIQLETLSIVTSGVIAFELGRAHLKLVSGESAVGRYVVLWKERHGEWRAKIDFFAEDGWID